jgi:hypothetical protein
MVCQIHEELNTKVYDYFEKNYPNADYMHTCFIMAATNDIIQERKLHIIKQITGELITNETHDEYIETAHNRELVPSTWCSWS